jgi:multidrug resistance efflux pump
LASLDCSDARAELTIAEAELELHQLSVAKRARAPEPIALQIAKDRLELAESSFEAAEATRERLETVSRENSLISRQELEVASRRAMMAHLEVSTAQQALAELQKGVLPEDEREDSVQEKIRFANIARARYQVSLCDIVSPVDGIVVAVRRRPAEIVSATEPVIDVEENADDTISKCTSATGIDAAQRMRGAGTKTRD